MYRHTHRTATHRINCAIRIGNNKLHKMVLKQKKTQENLVVQH